MKIVAYGISLALACAVFTGSVEGAKTPTPGPTPTPVAPPIPPPQLALHDQLLATLSAPARAWVPDEAAKARKNARTTEGNIRADIQTRFTGQGLTETDKNILLFIVLTEAARDMGDDLQQVFQDLIKKHAPQAATSNGGTNITLSPEEMAPLQAAVQRRTDFMTEMTTVMKKISGAQGVVVGNLR